MKILISVMALLLSIFPSALSVPKREAQTSIADVASMLTVESGESLDTANGFFDDFSSGIDRSSWYLSKAAWGQVNGRTNGGVIPQNASYDASLGTINLLARGANYLKKEVEGVGDITDGSCTGSSLLSAAYYGPGRFVSRFKPAPRLGVCNAFWTYVEDAEGINHEIDIEFPAITGNINDFKTVAFTNYVGSDTPNKAVLSNYLSDGNYHTFGFDWYYSASHKLIRYFIDGNLLATATTNIPFLTTRIALGVWIPNNADFVGLPNFELAQMNVDYVSYIPFKEQSATASTAALPSSRLASDSEYPGYSVTTPLINQVANGDFEYAGVNATKTLSQAGFTHSGSVSIAHNVDNNSTYFATLASGSSLSQNIDSVYASSSRDLSFRSQGSGTATLRFLDSNGSTLSSQDIAINDSLWTVHSSLALSAPATAYSAQLSWTASTSLALDDLSFVPHSETPITTITDSLAATSLSNTTMSASLSSAWTTKATVNFSASSAWKASSAKYSSTLILGTETSDSSSKSATISNYGSSDTDADALTMKAIYAATSTIDSSHFTQALWMDYDISSFSDITLYISGYAIDPSASYYHNVLLYSTDQGASYQICANQFLRNSASKNTNEIDPYAVSADASAISGSYTTLRFAYASIAFSLGGQGVHISGVVINGSTAFKEAMDSSTICSSSSAQQKLLAVVYAHLSDSERLSMSTLTVKGDNSKTYEQRYQYLLSYWGSSSSANVFADLQETNWIYLAGFLGLSWLLLLAFLVFNSHSKKSRIC